MVQTQFSAQFHLLVAVVVVGKTIAVLPRVVLVVVVV
jgi:hypothetical protein